MGALRSAGEPDARRVPDAVARGGVDKVAARRDELATAALRTLAERGYSNTSLRDVAQNSEFSHGVLHYYFSDKTDLISHCVRVYKRRCVRRYVQVTEAADSAEGVAQGFIEALLVTLREDTGEQRLWYDMRAESLFDPAFREDVAAIDAQLRDMLWRILSRYAELAGMRLTLDPETAYGMFDGVFHRAVQAQVAGDEDAGTVLVERLMTLLPLIVRSVPVGSAPQPDEAYSPA